MTIIDSLRDSLQPAIKSLESLTVVDHHLEIEGRLGILGESSFDSNIGCDHFQSIRELLESCTEWSESKKSFHTKEYYHKGLRLTVDVETGKRIACIEKVKVETFDYVLENLPMDLRLSIAMEKTKTIDSFPKKLEKLQCREKQRTRYILNDFFFDLTEVQEKTYKLYQYEVEYNGKSKKAIDQSDMVVLGVICKLLDANVYCDNGFVKTKENELEEMNLTLTLCPPVRKDIK